MASYIFLRFLDFINSPPRIDCFTLELRKAPKGGKLHPVDDRINRIIAMVRARVEHPFRVIKRKRCVGPVVSTWGDFGHAALQLSLQEFGDGAPK